MKKSKLFIVLVFVALSVYLLMDYQKESSNFISGNSVAEIENSNPLRKNTVLNGKGLNCQNCNVILIVIDTLRADHIGAYGYEKDTSPNIDKLAEEGILFKNMIAQSSWTKQGTASILTGLYPKNHGASDRKDILDEKNVLLPEILQANGYDTYGFVTNRNAAEIFGFNQGYTKFFELLGKDFEPPYTSADEVNKKLIPFIKNLDKTSKQFIYVHYMDPHAPYLPKEKKFSEKNLFDFSLDYFRNLSLGIFYPKELNIDDLRNSKNQKDLELVKLFEENSRSINIQVTRDQMINLYDDEIWFNDKKIGELVQELKNKGMYENSIIIITSDHGEEFLEHNRFLHSRTLFDEQLFIPWIMKVPRMKNDVVEKQVNQIDILPTTLKLLGIPNHQEIQTKIDGFDVFSDEEREYSFSELDRAGLTFSSIRSMEDKLIVGGWHDDAKIRADYGWPIWFEKEAKIKIRKGEPVAVKSFLKERKMEYSFQGSTKSNFFNLHVLAAELNIDWDSINSEEIEVLLKTSDPCTKVETIGIQQDRCLSFGIVYPARENVITETKLEPLFRYYDLINNPKETLNIYLQKDKQDRRKKLDEILYSYLDKNDKNEPREADLTPEILEELEALGYIN
jgi:arylsulfatase A-like enzyme